MERIQATRFSFRRKGSKNKEREARERDATVDFDYDTLSYLRSVCCMIAPPLKLRPCRYYYYYYYYYYSRIAHRVIASQTSNFQFFSAPRGDTLTNEGEIWSGEVDRRLTLKMGYRPRNFRI